MYLVWFELIETEICIDDKNADAHNVWTSDDVFRSGFCEVRLCFREQDMCYA